jgi:uncharacterized membrane protein (DUF485 family)
VTDQLERADTSDESAATGAPGPSPRRRRPRTKAGPQRVWREQVLIRVDEIAAVAHRLAVGEAATPGPGGTSGGASTPDGVITPHEAATPDGTTAPGGSPGVSNSDLDLVLQRHLETARAAALGASWWPAHAHARMERAVGSVHAAEAVLLSHSPDDYLRGQMPGLIAHVQAHLPPLHPQRVRAEELAVLYLPADDGTPARVADAISTEDREALVEANREASWASRREFTRLRSFRAAVVITALAMLLLAVGLALVSARHPSWMPLCFAPQGSNAVVCPTTTSPTEATDPDAPSVTGVATAIAETARSADAAVVMLVGLAGAAVTGTAALRQLRGTSTPFAVPMALLLLKLPTGALTAFLGLLLLHGDFVPGLTALDSSGQILAWALVFGAAQQLVTGLVDRKAQSVLDSVGSAPMTEQE